MNYVRGTGSRQGAGPNRGLIRSMSVSTARRFAISAFGLLLSVTAVTAFPEFPAPADDGNGERWNDSTLLSALLSSLGDTLPESLSASNQLPPRYGYDLVHKGFTVKPNGDTTRRISTHFLCTDCHNTAVEDPDLRVSDPETRLDYVASHDLPFLPGTTLRGVVDRRSWYNGFYQEKYGVRAEAAHTDLGAAVQLCASECSQGRPLDEWEFKAVLSYLRSIGLRLGDLGLRGETWERIRRAAHDKSIRSDVITELWGYVLGASPATLDSLPDRVELGYGFEGDSGRGAALYRLGCMHCHNESGPADFKLDYSPGTFRKLRGKSRKSGPRGLVALIRRGTHPTERDTAYMPLYTLERMSDREVDDLRAFIFSNAARVDLEIQHKAFLRTH